MPARSTSRRAGEIGMRLEGRGMTDNFTIMVSVLLVAALLSSAHAQVRWDGHRLHAKCQQGHGPSSDCAVFIRVTIDRYHDFIATHCARQSVPFDKIVESVIADLKASPSTRNWPADKLILESIGKLTGCQLLHASGFCDWNASPSPMPRSGLGGGAAPRS